MSCCGIDQSKCTQVPRNDSAECAKLAECTIGIHDHGLQRQALERVRECRQMGNAWDPIGPLTPLNVKYLYTDAPGYTTQGEVVEGFGFGTLSIECVVRTGFYAMLIALLIKYLLKKDISFERILVISAVAGLISCMAKSLNY
jgi:hypothetical protein